MIRRTIALIFAFIFLSIQPVQASPIVIDMPSDRVDITLGFSGKELNIYGTYEAPGSVAVVVRGPNVDMKVRKKEPHMGVWVNSDAVTFIEVPSYYDYAAPLSLQASHILRANGIGTESFDFQPKRKKDKGARADEFLNSLVRLRQAQRLLPEKPRNVKIIREGFFKANFPIPANAPTGTYDVTAYLFRDGSLLGQAHIDVRVAQIGFTAKVHNFALESALFYGLGTILLAAIAGFAANAALRRD